MNDTGTVVTVRRAEAAAGCAAPPAPRRPGLLPQGEKARANGRKAAARLSRLHARVASVRADGLREEKSELASRYETVVAEDLNVAGMDRERRLDRGISDGAAGRPGGCSSESSTEGYCKVNFPRRSPESAGNLPT